MAPHSPQRDLYFRMRALAREMRKRPTKAESVFWSNVRNRKLLGLKFNRQHILQCPLEAGFTKYYIVDFHCHALKLVVEIDGAVHFQQQETDLIRTKHLDQWGYTVIRFKNKEVLENWEYVANTIQEFMESRDRKM